MKLINLSFLLITSLLAFTSCDDDDKIDYTVPTSYNFENVNYNGQTQRLGMLNELQAYMKSANTAGTALDVNRLIAMYANSADAGWSATYDDSKQIRSKTFEGVRTDFDLLLSLLASASQSTESGTNGTAGVVTSNDGAKSYLLNPNGIEFAQVIEKGLMGALLYYQATSVYFGDDKMNVDNETITAGEGTEMEHHWDEAFGYFAVPTNFPTTTDGVAFWGDYCNDRDALLGSNKLVMDGFLKGRAAISNNDLTTRDEAIGEVRDAWEMVIAGTALHYLNNGLAEFNDMARRGHNLSEAIGFIYSLKFNTTKKITNDQIDDLLILVGGSSALDLGNLYDAEVSNIQEAKDKLAEWYNVTDKKDEF